MNLTSNVSNGRAVIPAALREQLGIQDGDQLIWEVHDGQLLVTTRRAQLRRAQALVQQYIGPDVSLSDELIEQRRAEQAAEDKQ
jgi:AbrB family looped-hinge helix DNA binding protein